MRYVYSHKGISNIPWIPCCWFKEPTASCILISLVTCIWGTLAFSLVTDQLDSPWLSVASLLFVMDLKSVAYNSKWSCNTGVPVSLTQNLNAPSNNKINFNASPYLRLNQKKKLILSSLFIRVAMCRAKSSCASGKGQLENNAVVFKFVIFECVLLQS